MTFKVEQLDHLVLTVKDIPATLAFYSEVLGMEVITFGQGRKALQFGTPKINLDQQRHGFEPLAAHPCPGSADLCFITQHPIESVVVFLHQHGVEMLADPLAAPARWGRLCLYIFEIPMEI
jgi:catechol 2,3-dioxygenase-like lactoylglutathione lyase family enzyme